MDCKTKKMSSYQRMKYEANNLFADLIKAKATIARMQSALWAITKLQDTEIEKAKALAIVGLIPDETD